MTVFKPNKGFCVTTSRHSKAKKILKIIEDSGKNRNKSLKLLDIGTGNGEIAQYLSEYFDVTSVDTVNQSDQNLNFSFILVTDEHLPFSENSFDIIVSNHVIEHVKHADLHLAEMARTLAPGGLIYLATPNRLWPWEVHYQVALLHYLPQPLFMHVLKFVGLYHEDIWLLSWAKLKAKAQKYFLTTVAGSAVCKWPDRYYLNVNKSVAMVLSWIPLWLYDLFTVIQPTLIVTLKPK